MDFTSYGFGTLKPVCQGDELSRVSYHEGEIFRFDRPDFNLGAFGLMIIGYIIDGNTGIILFTVYFGFVGA